MHLKKTMKKKESDLMVVEGFIRIKGNMHAMVKNVDGKTNLHPIPVKNIKGSVRIGCKLAYNDKKELIVIGEVVCASCGFDQLGGDNK